MAEAKSGDTVRLHYTGTLNDGTEFDSSAGRDPLGFTIGAGDIIAGFEQAVIGMVLGESKSVTIASDRAYGARKSEMVQEVDRANIPAEIDLETGMELQASGPDGQMVRLTVIELNDGSVTLDANHPLAGKDLTFDLELVEIV
jgi:FKBP-type peptidyl-prolyl cis-trans isomerase 2